MTHQEYVTPVQLSLKLSGPSQDNVTLFPSIWLDNHRAFTAFPKDKNARNIRIKLTKMKNIFQYFFLSFHLIFKHRFW